MRQKDLRNQKSCPDKCLLLRAGEVAHPKHRRKKLAWGGGWSSLAGQSSH